MRDSGSSTAMMMPITSHMRSTRLASQKFRLRCKKGLSFLMLRAASAEMGSSLLAMLGYSWARLNQPALLQLFALAGNEIHGSAGWFKRAHEYPNMANNELPISAEAARSIKNDKPFLQRYLNFWVANLVERMWLVMGIIIAVLLPLSRIVPPLYEFRVRSRIFRWYGQLRDIESRIEGSGDNSALLEELGHLESRAERISVPLSYTDELYALRSYIQLVRQKLQRH